MTKDEINTMFPPSYGGNAQISDIRLALTYLVKEDGPLGSVEFFEVATYPDMVGLVDVKESDLCKVLDIGNGTSQTYIWDDGLWKILVESTGGGGPPPPAYDNTTENFVVTSTQAQNFEVALGQIPSGTEHIFVFLNGMYMMQGGSFDWVLIGQNIQFNPNILTQGDNLAIKYSY